MSLPTRPAEYHQLLHGPRARPWKPVVTLLLVLGAWAALIVAVSIVAVVASLGAGLDSLPELGLSDPSNPLAFGLGNLLLAALIPTATLSTWAVHRVRPGFVSSVVGRVRWGWLARCTLSVLPIWLIGLPAFALLSGESLTAAMEPNWLALAVLVLVSTPLQAAGEEYFFRGWLLQNVGAWSDHRWIGWGLGTTLSATLFALAHGSMDAWILIDLVLFAVVACWLTWRTGGLEAAIAIHTVNNVVGLLLVLYAGGFGDAFISEQSAGSPWQVGQSAILQGTALAVIWWQARRQQVARRHTPGPMAAPSDAPPPGYGSPGISPAGTNG